MSNIEAKQSENIRYDFSIKHFLLTINNPNEFIYTDEGIQCGLMNIGNVKYACWCTEIGANGTEHKHLYILFKPIFDKSNNDMFHAIKKVFPKAHIDICKGNTEQNISYVKKEGLKHSDKSETSVPNSFFEYGIRPYKPFHNYKKTNELLCTLIDRLESTEAMVLELYYTQMKGKSES